MIDILTHDNAIIVAKVLLYGHSFGMFLSMLKDVEKSNKSGVVASIIFMPIFAWTAWML